MRATIMFLGVFLLPFVEQDPPIRHVPPTVDSPFAERGSLCPNAPSLSGVSRPNDARRSVAQVLGSISAVDVHQFGRNFVDFAAVQAYLHQRLAQKPRVLFRHLPWANATPLAAAGVLGTLHYASGSTGVFEATDVYLRSGFVRGLLVAPRCPTGHMATSMVNDRLTLAVPDRTTRRGR
jgi:hypothetical protein